MEEKRINQMSLVNCDLDEVEIVLGDKFEIVLKEGKYYAVRKQPKYPTSYESCLRILGYNISHTIPLNKGHNGFRMMKFQRLLVCRDAYWMIAGDWKPNFANEDKKFIIACFYGKIYTTSATNYNRVLVFPTEEMRDAFYVNFEDLIEECKDLL